MVVDVVFGIIPEVRNRTCIKVSVEDTLVFAGTNIVNKLVVSKVNVDTVTST